MRIYAIKTALLSFSLLGACSKAGIMDGSQLASAPAAVTLSPATVETLKHMSGQTISSFQQMLLAGVDDKPIQLFGHTVSGTRSQLLRAMARRQALFPAASTIRQIWDKAGFAPEEGVIRGDFAAALTAAITRSSGLNLTVAGPSGAASNTPFTSSWASATPQQQCALAGTAFQDAGLGTVAGGGCADQSNGGAGQWQWPGLPNLVGGQSCTASAQIWTQLQADQDTNVPDIYSEAEKCPGVFAYDPAVPNPGAGDPAIVNASPVQGVPSGPTSAPAPGTSP